MSERRKKIINLNKIIIVFFSWSTGNLKYRNKLKPVNFFVFKITVFITPKVVKIFFFIYFYFFILSRSR